MFVYIDESGDLGFKKGSSKFFVIAILKTKDILGPRRCIKRIRQRKLKKKIKELPEIKANKSTPQIRRKLLKEIAELDIELYTIVLEKEKVFDYLRSKKHRLFNYIAGMILPSAISFNRNVRIIIDKRASKKILRTDFDDYITMKIEERSFFKPRLKISHFDSRNELGLQAIDFVCWCIFRKYEYGDEEYYKLIQNKIKNEFRLFE